MKSAARSSVRSNVGACGQSHGVSRYQCVPEPRTLKMAGKVLVMLQNIGNATRKSILLGAARLLWRLADRCNRAACRLFVRSLQ
jgi:hypothetical protein